MQSTLTPIHFANWIRENRGSFVPPVGNKEIWPGHEFIVMVVGGPNARTDFHINQGEEFFYQLEGDIVLRILENEKPKDVVVRAGEIFLLPGGIPHSPQRPAGTLGLVIERKRRPEEQDGLMWICSKCHTKLYEEYFHMTDIVTQMQPVFKRFFEVEENCTCKSCGHREVRP